MDDMITKQQAIDALCMLLDNWFNTDWRKHINVVAAIEQIPSAQSKPDWNELLVICDNCGHAIRVKRVEDE